MYEGVKNHSPGQPSNEVGVVMESPTILIVEDEAISAMNLERKVKRLGYVVVGVAASAKEAIELAREKRPQIILMDIALKGEPDGIDASQKIREFNIPVVYLTALTDASTMQRVRTTEPFAYLVKPIEEKLLQLTLEIALYKHSIQQKLQSEILSRKRAEAVLEETTQALRISNESLEKFALIASHDLREPMRTMALYIQLIEKELEANIQSKVKKYLDFVLETLPQMQNLVDRLLEYAQLGSKGAEKKRVDCNKVYTQALKNLECLIRESGAEIKSEFLPTILADEGELIQVFQNLISNAIKFKTAMPPAISISSEMQGNEWNFRVKDNGIGIPPSELKRVFSPFRRLNKRSEYQGSGIGLSICEKIIQSHGGKIRVESEVGMGSSFNFTLPANETEIQC